MELFTDLSHRIAYATDASVYRELPLAVAFPKNEQDIIDLIAEARRRHTHLIPRAAGTSIAGQVVGDGIVVDISRHFTHILKVNQRERWAWVEPGVVRDELNRVLAPMGLFFSPETSTSNRCCIGGMVGNNSCGTHSLVYGSTRHHLLALQGILSDGSRFDTSHPDPDNALLNRILAQLDGWAGDPAIRKLIADNFPDPSLRRRSCGYAIDEAFGPNALCNLICGSEGTLCFITAIQVSLDPLPSPNNMVLCAHCQSLPDSYRANLVALRHHPVAIELMDGKILQLCQDHLVRQETTGSAPLPLSQGGVPAGRGGLNSQLYPPPPALLITEFNGDDINRQADDLERELLASGLAFRCHRLYGDDINRLWDLRKAGLGVLTNTLSSRKPVGVVEDTAVAPERLPEYLEEFEQMMQRHGLSCVYYGHISTGELHLRPILDLKQPHDRQLFRQVAEETALLVRKYRGSLSGEHGDGRLRGEFIPLVYGQEVYDLMRQVKQCWDPDGVFNMHKIVDTPPMDSCFRGQSLPQPLLKEGSRLPSLQGRAGERQLLCRIEQCNGAAVCRKSNMMGGTMCPTFKLTHDELQSTRARANILRELLSGSAHSSPDTQLLESVLYSCLACKGCKGDCPSGFDMTRIRAEVLQMLYHEHGTPFRSWMVARMASVERLGHLVWPLYNFFATNPWSSALIKRLVSFTPERAIPTLSHRTMRQLLSSNQNQNQNQNEDRASQLSTPKPTVYLFADEFTNLQEAELGLTFAQLLTRLGYRVVIPRHVESGRAAISKGCLDLARRFARRNVSLLRNLVTDDTPLVGIEPSCILSFRDEYPDLVPEAMRPDAERLAKNCLLYDEFIMREVARGHITPDQFSDLGNAPEIWLHGHCHQKALVGIGPTADMLRLIPGSRVHVIPSSCCGMAGSFGYEKEHYRTSLAIGEMVLFPAVRKAVAASPEGKEGEKPVFVAAPGTSCRQQILDGTGIHAHHPIEILSRYLA